MRIPCGLNETVNHALGTTTVLRIRPQVSEFFKIHSFIKTNAEIDTSVITFFFDTSIIFRNFFRRKIFRIQAVIRGVGDGGVGDGVVFVRYLLLMRLNFKSDAVFSDRTAERQT